MNKKQIVVVWCAAILFGLVLVSVRMERVIPAMGAIVFIGGILIYALREK